MILHLMFRRSAFAVTLASAVLVVLAGWSGSSAAAVIETGGMPNFDALRGELAGRNPAALPALPAGVQAAQIDRRLGRPTFVWARADEPLAAVGPLKSSALIEARGRDYLRRHAIALKLSPRQISDALLAEAQATPGGGSIARFRQRYAGVEVFNRSLNVLMNGRGKLIAISGYFADEGAAPGGYTQAGAAAITAAAAHLGAAMPPSALRLSATRGVYRSYKALLPGASFDLARPARIKSLWYPRAGGLEPAYYIELSLRSRVAGALTSPLDYALVISGRDGSVLFRKDQKSYDSAYSYRVFADAGDIHQPFDAPLGNGYVPFTGAGPGAVLPRIGADAQLVTLASGPISTGDPWLPDNATTTTGNNADAYLDSGLLLGNPLTAIVTDGYMDGSGDLRTAPTSPNTFDYLTVADADPKGSDARHSAIVNLFYLNNWLHDFWYDPGFNEAAGNAQTVNYGRGGVDGDAILAEGQDASGRNNANMLTPSDGGSPIMQMYLFDGPLQGQVRVTAPTTGPALQFTGASFGPRTFDLSGSVAYAGSGPLLSLPPTTIGPVTVNLNVNATLAGLPLAGPSNGCTTALTDPTGLLPTLPALPQTSLAGKIALVDRGACNFTSKALFAMLSGATALVVVNNADGAPITMGNADIPLNLALTQGLSTDQVYQLPSIMITKAAGAAIKAQLAAGRNLQMRLQRQPSIDYDGTFDELVIAHEHFHHVSNRLVGDGSGLDNQQGGSMGEGWSDFSSLLLSARPDDLLVEGNSQFGGAYPTGFYVIPDYYFGIRRMPYSTDFTKNSLTFKHIQDGVPLPTTAPFAFGGDGAMNSEVHNSGEVWSNMLWECYTSLLRDPRYTLPQARARMQAYVIAGLKMTPVSPTYTEARDGILAAALATDAQDYALLGNAFARRGIGSGAVAPARDSIDHAGVVESYAGF